MATDLTVVLENRPGTLAEMGEVLGKAGVNIDGMCAVICAGEGVVHILVENAAGARSALKGAGVEVRDEREVLVLDIEDRPGALGEITRRLADAGVDLDLAYLATNSRLVLGPDDLSKARAAV